MTVYERNRLEDTFGFGVVFSDETLENVGEADPETNQAMAAAAARWEDIEIHYRGTVMRSTGHRFSGRGAEDAAGAARAAGAGARRRGAVAAGDPGLCPTAACPPPI